MVRLHYFKSFLMKLVVFCHNHCHYTYNQDNINKSVQMNTFTKIRVKTFNKTLSQFTNFNPYKTTVKVEVLLLFSVNNTRA